MTVETSSESEADTRSLGRRLAGLCRAGDVILLAGGLGVGKTVFAGGLGEGLGVEESVTSPSFVLMRRYEGGFLPFVHADVYRLGSRAEIEDLDLLAEAEDGVLVVEWGQAVGDVVPEDHLLIEFEVTEDGARLLRFRPRGSWSRRPLEELAA